MHSVELSEIAVGQLREMIDDLKLPAGAVNGVRKSLRALGDYPLSGPRLVGDWEGYRYVLGPWNWMILVYAVLEDPDRVAVVEIVDTRKSSADLSHQ